jgi:GT2 family glycosyltransferase
MIKVSICIVAFNNNDSVQRVVNEIAITDRNDYEVIIIDNNIDNFIDKLVIPKEISQIRIIKNYNSGMLSGATNEAIDIAEGQYFVYLCGNHTHINSPDWLTYMMEKLGKHHIGGTVSPYFISGHTGMHVQGGSFIGRTDTLFKYPYNVDKFPFSFMDVDLSIRLLKAGYKLIEMPEIKSVKGVLQNKDQYKLYDSHT